MVKVHVLGGSGSGKTTFAQAVASQFHVPHYDLDVLGQRNGTNDAAWMADIDHIVQQPGWVAEGIYIILTDLLLEHADYVVLLDVPWPTAAWRILRRHITNSLRGTNQYPGWKPLVNLLRYARSYYLNTGSPTTTIAQRYLQTHAAAEPATAASVLMDLEMYGALVIPPSAVFVRSYLGRYGEKVLFVRNQADQQRVLQLLAST